jgi:hypothetical protein
VRGVQPGGDGAALRAMQAGVDGAAARFVAVKVVAQRRHDPVDHAQNAADNERHHAADTDEGAVES